jgi:hypothetical protein
MGSIRVKLDCGCICQTHTDDLLDRGWKWEKIMERRTDEDSSCDFFLNGGKHCSECFAKIMAEGGCQSIITVDKIWRSEK